MKFGMCNEFCEEWNWESVCELAARAGYDGVEIAPFTLGSSVPEISTHQRDAIRKMAAQNGLEIVGLHWLLSRTEGMHMNHPDDEVRRRTADYLRAEIELCADLGGDRMIVGSPEQRNVPEGETYEATWDRSVELFKNLARHAGPRGITLCIEPLAPNECNFIQTAAEARRLVEAVDHPAFQMMLDVKAMCSENKPIPDIIRSSAQYLEHFHANDANLRGPGFGDTDFEPIAEALDEVGYDDWVSVEVFDFSDGPETIATESLRYLHEVFE